MKEKEIKSVEILRGHENKNFVKYGKYIYLELMQKFPNKTPEDLDTVLNIILSSLMCLLKENVPPDDHKIVVQLIYKSLNDILGEN